MQHRRFNTACRQLNVFVDFAFFVPAKARFKEPKVVGGEITTVPNRLPDEPRQTIDVITVFGDVLWILIGNRNQFFPKLGGD